MMTKLCGLQKLLDSTRAIDFLGPLALRLYLAPIFILISMMVMFDVGSIAAIVIYFILLFFLNRKAALRYFGQLKDHEYYQEQTK